MMCKDRIPFNKSRSQVYQPMGASLNSCYVHYEKPGLRSWHKNWARIGKNAEAQLELYSILTQGEDVIIYPQHSKILKGRKYPGKMSSSIIMNHMKKHNANNKALRFYKMKNLHPKP